MSHFAVRDPWDPIAWRIELMTRLADLRYEYRRESEIEQLTTTRPPVTSEVRPDRDWNVAHPGRTPRYLHHREEEPSDAVGRSMSGMLLVLVGQAHTRSGPHYGPTHPIRRVLLEWERTCRRDHRQVPGRAPMWTDHLRGPLCAELAWAVVRDGMGIAGAATLFGVEYPVAERLLDRASSFMLSRLRKWEDIREARERSGHDPLFCRECSPLTANA